MKYLFAVFLFFNLNFVKAQNFLDLCHIKWVCYDCIIWEVENPIEQIELLFSPPDTIYQVGFYIEQSKTNLIISDRWWFNEDQYYTYADTINLNKIIYKQCYSK